MFNRSIIPKILIPCFTIMAHPGDRGFIYSERDKATYSHTKSVTLSVTHTHTHFFSPETAVVLDYHIRN